MGKRGRVRKANRLPAKDPSLSTPPAAQLVNRAFERRFVTHVETNTATMAFVSDHDPVERWDRAGRLSDTQRVAIDAVRRLWRLAGITARVTASYGERIRGNGHAETRAVNEIEAREDLHRIQGYVPRDYWNVFENVCRHAMPAGVAGGDLGYGSRSAQDRAHMVVVFVADVIAMHERY